MPKFIIQIAQLVRQVKYITVEAPDRATLEEDGGLSEAYENYEDDGENWEIDGPWGAQEGTHHIVKQTDDDKVPDVVLE